MDAHVLQTMLIIYKAADKLHVMAEAFEAASAARPRDQELLMLVFASHVRRGTALALTAPTGGAATGPPACRSRDLAKQQQTALKLHKLPAAACSVRDGRPTFKWWAATILVLQAREARRGAFGAAWCLLPAPDQAWAV